MTSSSRPGTGRHRAPRPVLLGLPVPLLGAAAAALVLVGGAAVAAPAVAPSPAAMPAVLPEPVPEVAAPTSTATDDPIEPVYTPSPTQPPAPPVPGEKDAPVSTGPAPTTSAAAAATTAPEPSPSAVPASPSSATPETTTPASPTPVPEDAAARLDVEAVPTPAPTPAPTTRPSATRLPEPPPPADPPPAPRTACSSTLRDTQPHVAQAGRFLMARYGIPESAVIGRAPRARASEHPRGLALDFLVGRQTGDALADYVLSQRAELGVTYVIWRQRYNAGAGWELMEDRGGDTANHFDHVHVSFGPERGSVEPRC